VERGSRGLEDYGPLFEYTVKFLLLASFLELVLYRLVSRLGMHLSKIAEKHEWVRSLFRFLSAAGFTLLNCTSILLFLALFLVLFHAMRGAWQGRLEALITPTVSLLLALTLVFLLFPPAMLGSIVYNLVSLAVMLVLAREPFLRVGMRHPLIFVEIIRVLTERVRAMEQMPQKTPGG